MAFKPNLLLLPEPALILTQDKGFRPTSVRFWGRDVKKLYYNRCVLTGLHNDSVPIVAHHLYSNKDYKQLRFSVLNGITLTTDLHKYFHGRYGMHVTPLQFINFIDLYMNHVKVADKERCVVLKNWINFLDLNM